MTILGCCRVYQYLSESLSVRSTDDMEMYALSGDLLTASYFSFKEKRDSGGKRLWNCAFKDPLAFVFHFYILTID